MKIIITGLILLFFISVPCFSQSEIIKFSDDFPTNTSQVSYKSNIVLISNSARIVSSSNSGAMKSINITRASNERWVNLLINYSIPTSPPFPIAALTFNILDKTNNILQIISSPPSTTTAISSITNKTIKVKANLKFGGGGSPKLFYWKVTVVKDEPYRPLKKDFFVGAPAPLILKSQESKIRFYYNFTKNCSVTLKIYDTNYRLVKTILNKESYLINSNLDAECNGKTGNNIYAISGGYIANIIIESSGSKTESFNFPFALIR